MNETELNNCMAEVLGWGQIKNYNTMAVQGIWRGYPPEGAIIGKPQLVPWLINDLNAVHKACMKSLRANQRMDYLWALIQEMNLATNLAMTDTAAIIIHAPANIRWTVLLKMLGKIKTETVIVGAGA